MTMNRHALVSALGAIVLASTLTAQAPVEKPADPPKAAVKPEPSKAPVFSEEDRGAIDVLALIAQRDQALKDLGACTGQLAPLQAQQRDAQLRQRVDALRQGFRKKYPGYDWDVEKAALVPIPPPKVAKAAGAP